MNLILRPHSVNIWGEYPKWDKEQQAKKYEIPSLYCISIVMDGELIYDQELLFGI